MIARSFGRLFIVALLLPLSYAQGKENKTGDSTVTPATTLSATATDASPVSKTSTSTTSSATAATTTASTTPSTVQTTTPVQTTTAAPEIGGACSSNETCNNAIEGEARCVGGQCACADDYFNLTITQCLPVSVLKPTVTCGSEDTTSFACSWILDPRVAALSLSYKIEAKDLFNGTVTQCNSNIQQTSHCGGLVPGSIYNVTVHVTHGDHTDSTTTAASSTPAQPGEFNITRYARNASLTWTPSDGRVTNYVVSLDETGHDPKTVNVTSAIFTGLTPATSYNATVVAHSNDQKSTPRTQEFETLPDIPDPPTSPSTPFKNATAVTITWNAPVKPNGAIMGYQVCYTYKVYKDLPYTDHVCNDTHGIGTTLDLANLVPGAFYLFEIYTVNELNRSDSSASIKRRMDETVPGAVGLEVLTGNQSLQAVWSRPDHPKGRIVTYQVQWKRSGQDEMECFVFLTSNESVPVQNTTCSANYTAGTVKVDQRNMTYDITQLQDYQKYMVQVTAYTVVGAGEAASAEQQTSIAKPKAVTNVHAEVTGSRSVNVSWALPNDRPGPVSYTVKVTDLVLDGQDQATDCSSESQNSTSCEVKELDEYWRYSFLVEAETEAGRALSLPSENVTTHEAAPGEVGDVNVMLHSQPGDCDATSVTLRWVEPALKNRNSLINRYRLQKNPSFDIFLWTFTVEDPRPYDRENRTFTDEVIGQFIAEHEETYQIYAVSEGGTDGVKREFTVKTGACAPPTWDSNVYSDIKMTGAGTATVTISYPRQFFTNTKQGAITDSGVLVANSREKLVSSVSISTVSSWSVAKMLNFAKVYKVQIQPGTRRRRKRSVVETFEVGSNSSCTTNPVQKQYCNGPLPDDFTVFVKAYACTKVDCAFSEPFGPFQTARMEPEEGASKAWLAAVLVLAFIAIALTVVLALMYFRGVNPRKWFKKESATQPPKVDDELENPIFQIPKNRPLALAKYDDQLDDLHKDTNLLFSDQYGDIGKLSEQVTQSSSFENANLEANKAKNRWVNILPYDHSRVKLQQLDEDDPSSDYINANYIPGFNNRREYIATQGPLPGTVDDFWRMVWEHNVQVIVMLTQCKEGNRVKCEKYWPDEVHEPKQYGDIVVNPVSISLLSKYCITIFEVSMNNQSRQIYHFHYLHFPDFSANVEFDVFIDFVQTVRSHVPHDMVGPIVVHCSAGVGRTGTFIGVDRLDQYIKSSEFTFDHTVDIFAMVMSMRENRVLMVQTESQFIMIHDCLKLLLDAKKQAMEQEDLYINEAFDPYPEVLYENVGPKGELKTEL